MSHFNSPLGPSQVFPPAPAMPGNDPETESEVDLKEYAHKLLHHWRLVALVSLLALAVGLVQYFMTPKRYMARAVLQLERRSPVPLLDTQNMWLENWWNMEYYPTQELLLQSRGLAERVVRNLRLEDSEEAAGEATVEQDQARLAALANGLRSGLSVRRIGDTQLVEISYRADSPEKAAQLANAFSEAFIEMGIENRFETAGKASSFLGRQVQTLRDEVADRESQLQALSRRTDVALDPEANMALERMRALDKDFIEAKRSRFEKESLLQELMAAPDETVADRHSGGEVTQLRASLLQLEQDYHTRLNTFKEEWPEMIELKSRIDKSRQHLQGVVQENAERARATARAEYQTALRQEQALESAMESQRRLNLDQKSSELEYLNLQNEVDTRRQLLNELLRRQSETDVTVRLQNTRESNVRVIDSAIASGQPYQPSLRRNVTFSLAAGLMLGIGLVLLIEYLDRTIKSSEQLERMLALPTLAVIPDIFDEGSSSGYRHSYGSSYGYGQESPRPAPAAGSRKSRRWRDKAAASSEQPGQIELLPHTRPRLAAAEAYRSLRTSLLLSSAEELRMVAVTSAGAGEGKSATVANLAVVMAQLGRNVLVVDGDLRKPRQHEIFKVSNRIGLVNYLTGSASVEDIFFRTKIPNLYLCPSGPIPPNPSELISSERMKELIRLVRSRFDFVLTDTPPALMVTDATLVGYLVDGLVLCCRAGQLQRDDARTLRLRLNLPGLRLLGAVLNRFRASPGSYRYGKKYYDYGGEAVETLPEARAGSAA